MLMPNIETNANHVLLKKIEMQKHVRISILGCGWLGLPLAEKLISRGHQVKGSTTSPDKLITLKNKGIDPYLVHFSEANTPISPEFLMSDVLIINIPPGRKSPEGSENYLRMSDFFCRNISQTEIKKIVLVSSTSVFNETNTSVSEQDLSEPESPAGKLLLKVENQFLTLKNMQVCVLRPAGLVAADRHPGRFFKNKINIPNGLAPINLIHRDDVIGIILKLLDDNEASGIYNGCSLTHPAKMDFYKTAAESIGFDAPIFLPEKKSWKIIESERVSSDLNYVFIYPDLLNWVQNISGKY